MNLRTDLLARGSARTPRIASPRALTTLTYNLPVTAHQDPQKTSLLDAEDQAWLEAMLIEYRELLAYLRLH